MLKTRLGTTLSILALAILVLAATASASADGEAAPALADASSAVDPASAQAATAVVESLHDSLIEVMKTAEELGYEGRREALSPVLGDSFLMEFMAKKAIGRSWKGLSEADQTRWLETFRQITCATYAGRFHGHSGQSFQTREVTQGSLETMMVQTTLLNPDGDDIELNYRLVETEKGWRIIDVYLEGTVSELALRRAEYSAVLKREGFQKLLADVDRRLAELSAVN